MENSEMPAFPMYNELGNLHALGLTKRELIASMAMQGLLANPSFKFNDRMPQDEQISISALAYADNLIKHLEK